MTPKRQGESGKLLTIRDALPLLDKSDSTVRRMIREGIVKIKRVGSGRGMIYIPASEIERLTKLD